MKVRLNIATKALQTHRRFLVGASLTAFFAAVAFVGLAWHVYSARKADVELRARTSKTRREMAELEAQRKELLRYFVQKDVANLHDRGAFINAILDARSFNWTLMFMDLERTLPGGVRVISIAPAQVGGHVELKLTVGATDDEAALKFEHALEESKVFTGLQIVDDRLAGSVGNQTGDQRVVQLIMVYSRS